MEFPFWQIIILQELFLYSIIIFAFNYEVETLIKLLKDTLQKPTSLLYPLAHIEHCFWLLFKV